jgi:hypothetical protein
MKLTTTRFETNNPVLAIQIPTQPLMLTIARGHAAGALMVSQSARDHFVSNRRGPPNPLGWNGARWHDGAD